MDDLISIALRAGADKATIIPVSSIVTSSSFRDICQSNGCGMYGRCWVCPPDVGEIDELIEKLRRYDNALLYQSISDIEDSFDIEGMQAAGHAHAKLSHRLEAAFPAVPHLHLSCEGCGLCERCAKEDGIPCRHPDQALPPMESYGIDVYQTTKNTELKYINGQNTVTFFGIVLY